jgi:hypothetical protein
VDNHPACGQLGRQEAFAAGVVVLLVDDEELDEPDEDDALDEPDEDPDVDEEVSPPLDFDSVLLDPLSEDEEVSEELFARLSVR